MAAISGILLQHAEEVGRLDHDSGGLGSPRADSSWAMSICPDGGVGNFHQFHVLVLDVGSNNLAIFRVQRSRQHHATAAA